MDLPQVYVLSCNSVNSECQKHEKRSFLSLATISTPFKTWHKSCMHISEFPSCTQPVTRIHTPMTRTSTHTKQQETWWSDKKIISLISVKYLGRCQLKNCVTDNLYTWFFVVVAKRLDTAINLEERVEIGKSMRNYVKIMIPGTVKRHMHAYGKWSLYIFRFQIDSVPVWTRALVIVIAVGQINPPQLDPCVCFQAVFLESFEESLNLVFSDCRNAIRSGIRTEKRSDMMPKEFWLLTLAAFSWES